MGVPDRAEENARGLQGALVELADLAAASVEAAHRPGRLIPQSHAIGGAPDPVGAGQGRPWPHVSYEVSLAPSAARELRKFGPQVRRRIQAALELLADDPRPPAATRLVGGGGEWRVRTGDYRIIYEIHDGRLLVLGLAVGHRRDVYDR